MALALSDSKVACIRIVGYLSKRIKGEFYQKQTFAANATEEYHHLYDNVKAGMSVAVRDARVRDRNTQPASIASRTNFAETFRIPFSSSTKSNGSRKGIKAFLSQITMKNCVMDMREI